MYNHSLVRMLDSFDRILNSRVNTADNKIEIPLPGIGRDKIKVKLDPNETLTVSYKDRNDTERSIQWAAYGYVDAAAEYKDGLLIITMQADKTAAAKDIKVA